MAAGGLELEQITQGVFAGFCGRFGSPSPAPSITSFLRPLRLSTALFTCSDLPLSISVDRLVTLSSRMSRYSFLLFLLRRADCEGEGAYGRRVAVVFLARLAPEKDKRYSLKKNGPRPRTTDPPSLSDSSPLVSTRPSPLPLTSLFLSSLRCFFWDIPVFSPVLASSFAPTVNCGMLTLCFSGVEGGAMASSMAVESGEASGEGEADDESM